MKHNANYLSLRFWLVLGLLDYAQDLATFVIQIGTTDNCASMSTRNVAC